MAKKASDGLERANTILKAGGLDAGRVAASVRGVPRFVRDWRAFAAQAEPGQRPRLSEAFPILADRDESSGTASGHYFHQDLWAARKVYAAAPAVHHDIGSRVDGFISHLLVFRDVTVIDIRPLDADVPGLSFVQADATDLRAFEDESVESISSLHAVEHFGLGRYGDPVDPDAHALAMRSLARVCRPGGRVYFALPVGRPRTMFNAHRILHPTEPVEAFAPLTLVDFAGIDSRGRLHEGIEPADLADESYACGLYEFTR